MLFIVIRTPLLKQEGTHCESLWFILKVNCIGVASLGRQDINNSCNIQCHGSPNLVYGFNCGQECISVLVVGSSAAVFALSLRLRCECGHKINHDIPPPRIYLSMHTMS